MSTETSALAGEQSARAVMSRRVRSVLAIDPAATALTFGEHSFPWSYYSDAVADLEALLADHPDARRSIVTLSAHLGEEGLAADIIDLAPDVIVADQQDWERSTMLAAAESVRAIALTTGLDRGLCPHSVPWLAAPALKPADDVAVLMMTSGTTGRPKRVELTYESMMAAFRAAGTPVDDSDELRLHSRPALLWASLSHIGGLYFAIAHALEGRSVALLEKFDVQAWAELVQRHQPGYVRLPPTALRMVLNADLPRDTFERVYAVGSGTAPLPAELADAFEERYGVPVLTNYGATEFAGAIAGWTLKDKRAWGDHKRGSVGRAHHGIELRVVDRDNFGVLPPGQTGLLEARGGQLPAVDGGWVRTNDLASIDEDGFLFIHGRADEAINRGGFKIPPSVIEDALNQHPAVDVSAAVALADSRLGEVPVVAVTLLATATEAELMEFLAARLTPYQRPVALKIVDALPMTASLKVNRSLVRDQFFLADPLPDQQDTA